MSLEQKCQRIVDCYHQISKATSRTYHLNGSKLKTKEKLEHRYQTVCFLVFHYWMKFKVNPKLYATIDNQLNVDEAQRNKQKAMSSKQKTATILPPIHIPQPKRRHKQKRWVLSLIKTFYVPRLTVAQQALSNIQDLNGVPSSIQHTTFNRALSNVSQAP